VATAATAQITDPPPAAVASEIAALAAGLDTQIPVKALDRNLLIGTWNIREFGDLTEKWEAGEGDHPKRDLRALRLIAEIVSRFDVIAIQEVTANIKALRHLLKALGPDWGLIMTDVTRGEAGNDERLAFVFDTRRVKPSGLAGELVVPPEWLAEVGDDALQRQFVRTPYAVSFVAGGRTFILVTLHVIWGKTEGDRTGELRTLARWLGDWAKRTTDYEQNFIALGDFNIERRGDDNFQAFTSTGLAPPAELDEVARTLFSRPGAGRFYDQIAWFDGKLGFPYTGRAGGIDFKDVVFAELTAEQKSWRMSDHFPLWAEFWVGGDEPQAFARFARGAAEPAEPA
jgi:endonuclease/exonuclease/phosphatase family metal-dependent hydrolase